MWPFRGEKRSYELNALSMQQPRMILCRCLGMGRQRLEDPSLPGKRSAMISIQCLTGTWARVAR